MLELLPGGANKFLSVDQAKALLATVRPRDIVGKTRRRLAAELITELAGIDNRIKTTDRELHGIGPSGAARLLGDVGHITRFADKGRFASWKGTAPLDASSGEQNRHRLSRAGNRRINRVLHIMAIVALRNDTEGRRYYRRKVAAGKSNMMALTALKRRLSDIVYKQMREDARRLAPGLGGQPGRHFNPTRPTHTPTSTLRISLFPDSPEPTLEPLASLATDTEGSHERAIALNSVL